MKVALLLREMTDVQLALLDLTRRKQPIIVENNLKELNQIIGQESSLVSKSRLLEKAIVRESEGRSLSSIVETSGDEESLMLRDTLLTTIHELKNQNEINQKLLNDSLAFVQGSLQLLQPNDSNKTYTRQASEKNESKALFDSKA
ncbi:flagellar protein FlgN [Bacillus sp. JCM 19041]|uniref:flagellar protein FlgN n=1 Tax=Bacillus sp. JCM 19041 TaxID=1460637 RepID=UPI0006D1C5B1